MKYPEYKSVNYHEVANNILAHWEKHDVFARSVEQRQGESFTFYEGPPSANGMPGIHHVMARAIKDIFCRFQTLKGKRVLRKGGWDTHGLPVELQVEKELGITKEDIGKKISVEEYNQKCREAVMRFTEHWNDLTRKMGYWVDLENPYVTYESDYMETLWQLLKRLFDRNLLYKGYTIQPFSPAAGTGLSSHELNMPGCYRPVKDTSITAQFKVKGTDNTFLLAWTTTPWTLPSNAALVVGEKIEYVRVETFNQYTNEPIVVYLAKNAVSRYFTPNKYVAASEFEEEKHAGKHPFTITETIQGTDLVGWEYEQLLPYVQPLKAQEKAFRVIPGDFVTTEDGTGIVHSAPTFGADDKRVADLHGVPPITVLDEQGKEVPLVDRQGRFVKEMGEFGGLYVKEEYESEEVRNQKDYKSTDVQIAIALKEANKAFKVEKYEHNYPHCWRTDKPILYYPMESWFIRTTDLKARMVELNKTINWKPASTGEGRFGNWLENLVDWNLSRSRYWGTPLPIWASDDTEEKVCVGSVDELLENIRKANASGALSAEEVAENEKFIVKAENSETRDLHRPYVDFVTLVSSDGKALKREADLIDVWFDSGAMPYAQWHYPFENEEAWKDNFPADFIAEGVDQTRGWFFTLHAIGTLLFDSVAFKNVVSNGLVLDKTGAKMSKSKGNAVNPFDTLEKYGADPTRWYMIENAQPWDNLKFDLKGLEETQRKFFGTLQNTYNFFALYANLDNYAYDAENEAPKTESDRWVRSRLHTLIKEVDNALSTYDPTRAARKIQEFVTGDVSNWFVRLNRKRFWVGEMTEDKRAAYDSLYLCLKNVAVLMSPIAPFFADRLFRDLHKAEAENALSVHLADFPQADEAQIDSELEARMALAQKGASLVHSLRKQEKIRVRQPLARVLIPADTPEMESRLRAVESILLTEVNVKKLEFLTSESNILVKNVKPNFKTLGKRFGKQMKALAGAIAKMNQDDIRQLEQSGSFTLTLEGEEITLEKDDFQITSEDVPGWLVAHDGDLTVALDITLTDELRQEGLARDAVNRIQNLRKDAGLEVQDKIQITFQTEDAFLQTALEAHADYICRETQALGLQANGAAQGEELELEGASVRLAIEKQ